MIYFVSVPSPKLPAISFWLAVYSMRILLQYLASLRVMHLLQGAILLLQHHPWERSISLEVAFQASTTTNCSSSNLSTIPGGCLSTAAHHGPQGEVMGISGWHPMEIFTCMVAAALVSLTRKHIFSLTVFALHLSFLNLAFA